MSQQAMTLSGWKELPDQEQREIARQWSPYDTSEQSALLDEIVAAFRAEYPAFEIPGTGNVHGSLMLVVLRPFIFDKRAAPGHFLGVPVRYTLNQPVPEGFRINRKYVWAPENYLHFVEEHASDIRRELGNLGMTKEEMLAALVGMPFDDWIEKCQGFGPGHTNMVPGQRVAASKPWWKLW